MRTRPSARADSPEHGCEGEPGPPDDEGGTRDERNLPTSHLDPAPEDRWGIRSCHVHLGLIRAGSSRRM